VPVQIVEMMRGDDAAASGRMMQALLKMEKLDIAELQRAYIGA